MRHLCLTIDTDSISEYAAIHGVRLEAEDPLFMYRWPMRRFAELCQRLDVPATVFVITRDITAAAQDTLRHFAAEGFELATHTHVHDYRISERVAGGILNELRYSARVLEQKVGVQPVGFRAPGYTMSTALADELEALGFSYSSSVLPSPPYFMAKFAVLTTYWIAQRRTQAIMGSAKMATAPTQPYRPGPNPYESGERSYVELPVSVATPLRLPVTGAAVMMAPGWLRKRMLRSLAEQDVVVVNFHAMDFVDLDEAPLPSALIARQPEVKIPIAERERTISEWLGALLDGRQGSTCRAVADEVRDTLGMPRVDALRSSEVA